MKKKSIDVQKVPYFPNRPVISLNILAMHFSAFVIKPPSISFLHMTFCAAKIG